jgi:hypothetical protein
MSEQYHFTTLKPRKQKTDTYRPRNKNNIKLKTISATEIAK